jgi:hypothetical protein
MNKVKDFGPTKIMLHFLLRACAFSVLSVNRLTIKANGSKTSGEKKRYTRELWACLGDVGLIRPIQCNPIPGRWHALQGHVRWYSLKKRRRIVTIENKTFVVSIIFVANVSKGSSLEPKQCNFVYFSIRVYFLSNADR